MKPRIALSVAMSVSVATVIGLIPGQASSQSELRSAIAFTSTRDGGAGELYLMFTKPDGTPDPDQTHRLTQNTTPEGFAALSPDGTRIVFDSTRLVPNPAVLNVSDLFVMPVHDTDEPQHPIPDRQQKHLTRGSSASWSPDGKKIAFHASQSGTGAPEKNYVGAETADSDIFVMDVDACLKVIQLNQVDDCRKVAGPHVKNITNNGNVTIDDDPDWSHDGTQIVYVRHSPTEHNFSPDAEVYVMRVNPDGTPVLGTDNPRRLTFNSDPSDTDNQVEERGPSWSPDDTHIAYACRPGAMPPFSTPKSFKICVMDADGGHQTQLTSGVAEFTPTWSPDGSQIVFSTGSPPQELFWLQLSYANDGTITVVSRRQLTDDQSVGLNLLASWGRVRQ